MPAIYVVPAVLLLKLVPWDLTKLHIWASLEYIKNGLISIALITLGIQLSKTRFNLTSPAIYTATFLRLIGGPVLAYILIRIFHFEGIIAQVLIISSSVPTAVITALIAVERNNKPEYASQVVMASTIFSSITLSVVVYISGVLFSEV